MPDVINGNLIMTHHGWMRVSSRIVRDGRKHQREGVDTRYEFDTPMIVVTCIDRHAKSPTELTLAYVVMPHVVGWLPLERGNGTTVHA